MSENVNTYMSLFKLDYGTKCKSGASNSSNLCSASVQMSEAAGKFIPEP
jgi:hypothetical protein